MLRWTLALLLTAGSVLATGPAVAQHGGEGITFADPASPVGEAGGIILYYVNGRSLADAGTDPFNPFEIDGDGLLYSVGSFFITAEYAGEPVHEGEFSIYPQFSTPYASFEASAATPGIIPFAFLKSGVCNAGYVAGHPVPDTVFAVALEPTSCHAEQVVDVAYTSYLTTAPQPEAVPEEPSLIHFFDPAHPSDIDLDLAVWAAYNGAYALATADPGYLFIRDGNFEPVGAVIASELEKEGLPGIAIEMVGSPAEAHGCTDVGRTVLRIAFTDGDLGVTLVAASDRRQSSYYYTPDLPDIDIRTARECRTSGFGRAHTSNVR